MQNTNDNTQKINSKTVKSFDEPKTPTDLKDAIRAIMLQQKKEICGNI